MAELNTTLVQNISKAVVKLNKEIIKLKGNYTKLLTDIQKGNKTLDSNTTSVKKLKDGQKKLDTTTRELIKLDKQMAIAEAKLTNEYKQVQKAVIQKNEAAKKSAAILKEEVTGEKKLAAALKETTAVKNKQLAAEKSLDAQRKQGLAAMAMAEKKERDLIAVLKKEIKSEDDLIKKTNALVAIRRKLDQTTVSGKAKHKALTNEINKNTIALKKQDAQIGRGNRNVGNYGTALKSAGSQLLGALGLTSAVYLFIGGIKNSITKIKDFGKENAVLAGVLNKQTDQIKELTNDAIKLGGIYPTLASDVTKLQVSYARLGFTQEEILDLTKDTIEGTLALNSELDATATLVGAIIKTFDDLESANAKEIIDKLTVSTQKTSLSFEKLEISIPKVAGAANALQIPFSRMLAQLGIAQDATQDASIAGTSLRNIYLELSSRGITLAEALEQINTSQNKLNASYKLFGKRGAIVGLALANNIDLTGELTKQIDESGGTAERVAKIQMATFSGAVDGMKSSWERLILSMKGSEGILGGAVGFLTHIIDSIQFITNEDTQKGFFYKLGLFFDSAISKDAANEFWNEMSKLSRAEKILGDYSESIKGFNEERLNEEVSFQHNIYLTQRKASDFANAEITKSFIDAAKKRIPIVKELELEAVKKAAKDKLELELAAIIEAERIEKILSDLRKSASILSNAELFLLEKEKLENHKQFALLSEEEKQAALKILRIKFNLDLETLEQEHLDSILEKNRAQKAEIELMDEDALDALIEGFDKEAAAAKKKDKEIIESAKKKAEEIAFITDALGLLVGGIADGLYDKGKTQRTAEIDAIRLKAETEAISEEKAARQIAAIKTKQAKADKKQAMFNIILSTAEGVAKAWGQTGIFGLAAQVPVLIMGGIRLGIAAAQPIPEFKEGTKGKHNTPDTFITSEKGAGIEWVEDKLGNIIETNKPTLHTNSEGFRVYSNEEIKKPFGHSPSNSKEFESLVKEVKTSGRNTVKAISNIRIPIVDETGRNIGFKRGTFKKKYI